MRIYKSSQPDIELPHVDILTLLFGALVILAQGIEFTR